MTTPVEWAKLREAGLVTRKPHEAHKLTEEGREVLLAVLKSREQCAFVCDCGLSEEVIKTLFQYNVWG